MPGKAYLKAVAEKVPWNLASYISPFRCAHLNIAGLFYHTHTAQPFYYRFLWNPIKLIT